MKNNVLKGAQYSSQSFIRTVITNINKDEISNKYIFLLLKINNRLKWIQRIIMNMKKLFQIFTMNIKFNPFF